MRIAASLLAVAVGACASSTGGPDSDKIDTYIHSLPYLPVGDPNMTPGQSTTSMREGDYSCTTTDMTETRQFDRIVAYAANSDSLYPGAIVSADSVLSGLFTQIVLPRAPETISISLENLEGTKKADIADPRLSSYREALSSILDKEITGSTPANLYSEIEEVHSDQQLNMALGVQASWGLGLVGLKSNFDWSNETIKSRYVVRYTQAYYTVDIDAPGQPSDMLGKNVTLDDVTAAMDDNRPPAYVSSVTYGRMIVFTFESQYSSQEMNAALDFAYSGGIDVSGDTSVTYKDIISSSKITAYILGGDGGMAAQSIDSYDSLIAFIKSGGNYSRESPGAPIAYKLSYLKDNSPARISLTTDYQIKNCVRVSQKVKVTLESIAVDNAGGDGGDDLEIFGQVWATGINSDTLFLRDRDHYVEIHQGQAFGTMAPIGEAVIDVAPMSGQAITLHAHLFDQNTTIGVPHDDDLGDEQLKDPFETGWRKESTINLTGSGARVRVVFSLTPI